MSNFITRRRLLTGLVLGGAGALAFGASRMRAPSSAPLGSGFLSAGEALAYRTHRFVVGDALAREYDEAALSPDFRANGNVLPRSPAYRQHTLNGFEDWRLRVSGLVEKPQTFSLAHLRALPSRTQITRHDCVEGWSAIGKWTGVPLAALLNIAGLQDRARFIVFRCADDFRGVPYYESIDLREAFHPQTILAYAMNDTVLPVRHGAPLRLRVERQLGYKQAKYVMQIEAVESLSAVGAGRGGYWEDVAGYAWYAGI